jgi:hypothetical protein
MKRRIGALLGILVALLFFSTAGNGASQWKGQILKAGGYPIIHNPSEPMYPKAVLSLREDLKIGEAEGQKEYVFGVIGSIAVDPEENIYISDSKEIHIKKFDRNGKYLKTIGRKGQGPGEFEQVTRIMIDLRKHLTAFDGKIRRLTLFSPSGDFIKTISIREPFISDLRMNSRGGFLISTYHIDPQTSRAATSLSLSDDNFNIVKSVAVGKSQNVLMPFQPFFVWTAMKNDHILFGFNDRYEITRLDGEGNMIMKISRDYQPVPVKPEERKRRLEWLEQPLDKKTPPDYPAFQSITTDEEGRIIVRTYEKSGTGEGDFYDIFDAEGRYISKIVLQYPPRLWKQNKLYTVEEDSIGFQSVKRYEVKWMLEGR